ncbi:unnamed protein product [Cyprideis torosa]|uniref:PiggyBac transposable element-derived protein domain-containing protein n=1 Tax=Cyprideis torosa TaxID=163714 RepID=A0A7R8W5Q1_9CRUS|nr:unnamed protein product [Cyprideis torosa]CAG0885546.1 unnamed protein product [Cyprideis torosa]
MDPLHVSSFYGHQAVAVLLLDRGADANATDEEGWTPLHVSSFYGHQAVPVLLLDRGADANATDKGGWTPLHLSSFYGHQAVAVFQLKRGPDVNATDEGRAISGSPPFPASVQASEQAGIACSVAQSTGGSRRVTSWGPLDPMVMAYNLRQKTRRPALVTEEGSDEDVDVEWSDVEWSDSGGEDSSGEDSASEKEDGVEEDPLGLGAEEEKAEGEKANESSRGFSLRSAPSANNVGRDSTVWRHTAPGGERGRPAARNIVAVLPGAKGPARNAKTSIEMWFLFFTDDLLQSIVECSNMEHDRIKQKCAGGSFVRPLCVAELKAFLGLLYLAGLSKSGKRGTDSLDSMFASPLFHLTRPKERFKYISVILRFDNKATRPQRREGEQKKLAPIYDVFHAINSKSIELYSASPDVTVDETINPFRGRTPFRIHMPSKPDRYGLESLALCDARTA